MPYIFEERNKKIRLGLRLGPRFLHEFQTHTLSAKEKAKLPRLELRKKRFTVSRY